MNSPDPAKETRAFELPRPPVWIGLAWGFAEATFFFIVPDLVITLAVLSSFKLAARHLGAVLAGSIAGGILMYWAALAHPDMMPQAVMGVPFVNQAMFETVRTDFSSHGVWALCLGPLSGIPYKVYAVVAPAYAGLISFALVSVPARIERLVASLALFALVGWLSRKFWPGRARVTFGVYIVYWLVVYGYYWTTI